MFVDHVLFDAFYDQTQIGSYTFTVLDSGEDKEDGNYEYAGYNDYAPIPPGGFAEQTGERINRLMSNIYSMGINKLFFC